MPGFVVDISTTMTCPHGGKVTFVPSGRAADCVRQRLQAVMTAADQITVRLGALQQPTPCVKGGRQWANTATVLVNGTPMLTQAPALAPPPVPGGGVRLGSAAPGPPLVTSIQLFVTGR